MKLSSLLFAALLAAAGIVQAQEQGFKVDPTEVKSGYDRIKCWTQAGAGIIPDYGAILTAQKALIAKSDDYFTINRAVSRDNGVTWTEFVPQASFERQIDDRGWEYVPADSAPKWHAASKKLLTMGQRIWYKGEEIWREKVDKEATEQDPRGYVSSNSWYGVYDTETESFGTIKYLRVPKESAAVTGRFGCAQRWDLPDGDILIPVYANDPEYKGCYQIIVMRCSFDGNELVYKEEGTPVRLNIPRGFAEPQLVGYKGKFYLSLRNDIKAYLAVSDDGMTFSNPVPWTWKETGEEIGSYNTQQHWARVGDQLLLVYTRRGANNDHIIRNRAPLFVAVFCPESMALVKATEQIAVPERGAPLGNFGVTQVSDKEAWVIVAEDMQSPRFPAPDQYLDCEKHGSNNTIWLSRLTVAE
ncbi:MAG: exo-alpha-sialidase [Planctomycetia bacterium]|nr:exo-alpha-sialidase [Planctomycetia bacterium]